MSGMWCGCAEGVLLIIRAAGMIARYPQLAFHGLFLKIDGLPTYKDSRFASLGFCFLNTSDTSDTGISRSLRHEI